VIGSLACGFSSSLPTFVASRFLQGMGGAMMVPVGRLVLLKSVEKREIVAVLSFSRCGAVPVRSSGRRSAASSAPTSTGARSLITCRRSRRLVLRGPLRARDRSRRAARRSTSSASVCGRGLSALTLGAASFGQHLCAIASSRASRPAVVLVTAYVLHARRWSAKAARRCSTSASLRTPTYFVGVVGGRCPHRRGGDAVPVAADAANSGSASSVAVGTADVFVGPAADVHRRSRRAF